MNLPINHQDGQGGKTGVSPSYGLRQGMFLDPRDPVEVPRPTAASPDSVEPTGAAPPPPGVMPPQMNTSDDAMPTPVDPGAAPMEAARKRRTRRETPHKPDASDLDLNANPEWDDT